MENNKVILVLNELWPKNYAAEKEYQEARDLHRTSIAIRNLLSQSDEAIYEEAIRGEEALGIIKTDGRIHF